MRKLIIPFAILAGLALGSSSVPVPQPARAQNFTCPTAPVGTNDNQCASTAFVQQNAGAGGMPGGLNGNVQYNNAGMFGGLTDVQLTARIQPATAVLSGAVPAWPNDTTKFFRGDGTYAVPPGGGGTPGGVNGNVQFNNAGAFGGLTDVQLTARIQPATNLLSGAVPAWPNNTTTFFRGDGTYAAVPFTAVTGSLACSQFPALTGDITTPAGSCATTLATVNLNTGSFGTATQVAQITVNGKGLITAAANVTIAPPFSAITGSLACSQFPALTGDITTPAGSCATTLATVNANTGSWGTATQVPQFTVNAKGLITAAANVTIAPPFSAITGQATLAQLPTMAAGTVLSNVTGGAATPLANTVSAVLDVVGATQGNILYRGASTWTVLAPGTAGQVLQTGGPAANPSWTASAGGGSVTSVATDASIKTSIAANGPITTTGTLSLWGGQADITNCSLSGTVSGGALTVSLLTQDGSTPSSTKPCIVSFRNATLATGDYTYLQVTAATTFATATSGSTFGAANTAPFRLWVTAWNNAGTVVLGVSNQAKLTSPAQVFPLVEAALQSSTACNACGTATAFGTFYTTAAQTTKAIRILGYMDWANGLTTAGTFASGPTTIQLFGPGVPRPGAPTGNTIYKTVTATATVASTTPVATTLTGSITPTAAMNLMRVSGGGNTVNGANGTVYQLGRNSSANLFGNVFELTQSGGMFCQGFDAPLVATSTTYTLFFSTGTGTATATFLSTTNQGGFTVNAAMTMEEIQG